MVVFVLCVVLWVDLGGERFFWLRERLGEREGGERG